ncbi:MAG TPA: TraB/GumN family protein [Flavisolibacter sp.]|nr:TraB/GumN family protein [Flavisolibacter sp.]
MKKLLWLAFFALPVLSVKSQETKLKKADPDNTLLWRITGKNLAKPSYIFGTMHMICADDIEVSDSLKQAIKSADEVYLELNMNNIMEMMGAMTHMTMRNDTTLADLMTPAQYKKVKDYFNEHSSILPFSMIETYKPLLAASTIMEQATKCDHIISMEELIMQEAKNGSKDIKGLETMNYQLSIFDSIPYKLQARQLLDMVENAGKNDDAKEMEELTNAYRNQELNKMEILTKTDMGMKDYSDLLLYNRNRNWVRKIDEYLSEKSLVVAVGAGHLPGDKGIINLLRKAGYKVEPVKNDMIKKKVKEI